MKTTGSGEKPDNKMVEVMVGKPITSEKRMMATSGRGVRILRPAWEKRRTHTGARKASAGVPNKSQKKGTTAWVWGRGGGKL